tara:strand:+ start:407 stop:1156 length:750 start_codon:yes stop_codon:yes gene_type:complete
MIDYTLKCIYTAIPKTATSSMMKAFRQSGISIWTESHVFDRMRADNDGNLRLGQRRQSKHGVYLQDIEYLISINHKPSHYKSFSFVRNPWDRLVSAYCHLMARLDEPYPFSYPRRAPILSAAEAKKIGWHNNFETFVKFFVPKINEDRSESSGTGHGLRVEHWKLFEPQLNFLKDQDGKIPQTYIGRYENLQTDFNYVCEELLGFGSVNLPLLNHTPNRQAYPDYYNEETAQIVRKFYKEEITEFGYEF